MVITLPVSRLEVEVLPPRGTDDVFLLEAPSLDARLALALLSRLVCPTDGTEVRWGALTLTDLDAVLLVLRRKIIGDWIRTDTLCPTQGCGARINVSFQISHYLEHHRPRPARNVELADEGWYHLRGTPVSFRLPQGDDLVAVAGSPAPKRSLALRCIRPAELKWPLLGRVERAMEALAPNLAGDMQGLCPECAAEVDLYFDPQWFALHELLDRAAFIYEDVHLLAYHYHWSQEEILELPSHRRMQYTDMIRRERSVA
ncbi:MAG TPA: hypothetical protein VKA25_09945 [Gemmatimonadales bacterium]|nr:hypothetical protein [Gemmatimonadales bacterium]